MSSLLRPFSPDEERFVEKFENGDLDELDHEAHVRLAYLYLRRDELLIALRRFVDDVKRFAVGKGVPEHYHETVTASYFLLIHERMSATPALDWSAYRAKHADLLEKGWGLLRHYYRNETLTSPSARATFRLPDADPGRPQRV